MTNEIVCPFIVDEFNLSKEEKEKLEIAIVLINAELEKKKKEKLQFAGKLYYPFYVVPISKDIYMIFDSLKLFGEKIRLKDIESILEMDPDIKLVDPNRDEFISQINDFSKKINEIISSKGEKFRLDGLLNNQLTSDLGEFVDICEKSSNEIVKINEKMTEKEVLDKSSVFSKLFDLELGKFISYELKTIHSIDSALIKIYNKCISKIEGYDNEIKNLESFIESINKAKSNEELEEQLNKYEKQYNQTEKSKDDEISKLDKKEKVLYNSKDRLHESYNELIKYITEIQHEIGEFGIHLKDNTIVYRNTPSIVYLPIYVLEFIKKKKKTRFSYVVPGILKKRKNSSQTIKKSENLTRFETVLSKNYKNDLFEGAKKDQIKNILENFEETKQLFYDGINLISENKWIESGTYVKVMDHYNVYFKK
ncbi:MAG: hypothetical protein GF329_17085 [Candidatus Lokiarchaeota archaeon]|nr:hypothetical protein [Candidatus Lokiarchaeota archaeon]